MQIVYHIGVHCTDEDRLLRSILKNKTLLKQEKILAPGARSYRKPIREALQGVMGGAPGPHLRGELLSMIVPDQGDVNRLILSNENFICVVPRIFERGRLYNLLESKIDGFQRIFFQDEIEIFLSIRNPATFIPAVWQRTEGRGLEEYLQGFNPASLRWSSLCARIIEVAPHVDLTVWCNEDTPLIWDRLLHEITGLPETQPLHGGLDILADIMTEDGVAALKDHLQKTQDMDGETMMDIKVDYLENHLIPDAMEEELDVPGWTTQYVEKLTHLYDLDVERLMSMPGVNFIRP
ncbi:hypothetical protein [Pseudaestuariivita rosea]|uniref:hypothetical protein n=1 Tax=Pseudaestuariivita rosea TaxID=2763263 RepID=UPI001ABAFB4F|nr:hypothetical protein [Pseudaestuariivita rosea]